ncbi:UNVERIFIED_CONTAM: phage DNA encapsidation protein [Kocuria sp. CPCC 205274]|uniref:Phage DNA encapsidation protein n=1 Tax=Herbiconiux daphne TaxID=2970914 RepID=A0ABT2H8X6_9MICO|nr:phage DNA encapsidation protein [Herbiconiux daphne]MCS5736410.1 phage DNA encapsidation protein [Herbiconiux daphne]
MKYYSTTKIDKKDATYNVIFGERSNGKTYALLEKGVKDYVKTGRQMAYVRRWKEDITGRRAARLFAGLNENGAIEKITKGAFKGVHYWAGKFYLCNYDEAGKVIYADTDIVAFAFALSDGEHDKSTSFPNVGTIIFDEFLTNRLYLNDEFVLFMNCISTIVRKREDVKIYMLGNTVNKYCPYFAEMGLEHILKMKQGTIDVYTYGDSPLTVAVEYCNSPDNPNKEQSHKYFAFNNPKLSMITGGAWELNIYPHLPYKYKPKDILLTFFIDFNDTVYQCEVIQIGDNTFIYVHNKSTPIKDLDNDLIYSLDYSAKPNYNRSVFKPMSKVQQRIAWFFTHDRVFYQDNNVGDAIANYLKICKR